MKRFIHILSSIVRDRPWAVLIGAVVLTFVFAGFIPLQETSQGNEGFAPDSEEFLASETIGDEFPQSVVPFQVVFSAGEGDLLSADGVALYLNAIDRVHASRAVEVMADVDPIMGFLDRTIEELERQGIEPLAATDAEVDAAFTALTGDDREFTEIFLSERADLDAATSPTGLMMVWLNTLEDDPDFLILQDIEINIAEHVRSASAGGISVEPFSFALLFEDEEGFQSEIGRLFAAAGYIIMIILASVFLLVPDRRRSIAMIAGGFAVMAIVTALMVLDLAPIPAPFLMIATVFTAWSVFHRKLRRSVADTTITLIVIFMSVTWMQGIGVLFGPGFLGIIGPFNEMLQIVPILLIGLGVDYSIHLTARYREEMAAGSDVAESAVTASRTVGVALVLATVTTAVGFLTNLFSPVSAIADFGVVATVGIGAAFVLMLTFVPSLRILLDRRAEAKGIHPIEDDHLPEARMLPRIMGGVAFLAQRFAVGTLIVAFTLFGLGIWGFSNLKTTFSFIDFVPQDAPLLGTFELLDTELGGGLEGTNVLIEGEVATPAVHNASVDAFMALSAMASFPGSDIEQRGSLAWADSPVTALYVLATPPEAGGNPMMYAPEFVSEAAALGWEPDFSLMAALGGGGQPTPEQISAVVDQFKVGADVDVAALYDAAARYDTDLMAQVVAKDDAGQYRFVNVDIRSSAGETGARTLAESLDGAYAEVEAIDGITVVPTNQNIISAGVVDSLQASNASSLVLTLAAALTLLVLNFWFTVRRPLLGAITIAPVVLVVFWVFGAMAVTGITFNPVTAMIAAIAIGIGVPYTIHITHRYQEDRVRCATPEEAIKNTLIHTGGALAGSALTTVAGFGILVTSTLKPFQQFGLVVGYAIGFALVAAVLVLPSMLVLWDRWHRRRGDAVMGGVDYREAVTLPEQS